MTAKMQSCIDHIKTSTDVDPWAAEMVEIIFKEYDRRFDKVLEIIDGYIDRRKEKIDGYEEREAYYLSIEERAKMNAVLTVRAAIEELRGAEEKKGNGIHTGRVFGEILSVKT